MKQRRKPEPVAAVEPAVSTKTIPNWKRPKVHKGKQTCCPCCNPFGYLAARRQEAKMKGRGR